MSKNKIIHPKIDNETIEIKSKVKNILKHLFSIKIKNLFLHVKCNFNRNATGALLNRTYECPNYASLLHFSLHYQRKSRNEI